MWFVAYHEGFQPLNTHEVYQPQVKKMARKGAEFAGLSVAFTTPIVDWPSPWFPEPVPIMWFIPNGLDELFTKAMYSSSKIVSPATYAILLFNSYYAFV